MILPCCFCVASLSMVARLPWGEESLLREDTDESLWFFGPAGENNYRVAGVSWD